MDTSSGGAPSSPAISQLDPGYEGIEQRADVDGLLAMLPEREQTILRLRFYAELSQREIGERVGLSQMQVSRSIRAAIDELRERAKAGR